MSDNSKDWQKKFLQQSAEGYARTLSFIYRHDLITGIISSSLPNYPEKVKEGFVSLTYEKYLELQEKPNKNEKDEALLTLICQARERMLPFLLNLKESILYSEDTNRWEKMLNEIIVRTSFTTEFIVNLTFETYNFSGVLILKNAYISPSIQQALLATGKFADVTEKIFSQVINSITYNEEQQKILLDCLRNTYSFLASSDLSVEYTNKEAKETAKDLLSSYITYDQAAEDLYNKKITSANIKYILITSEDLSKQGFRDNIPILISNHYKIFSLSSENSRAVVKIMDLKNKLFSIKLSIPDATMISPNFMCYINNLDYLELDLPKVKTIESGFLFDCPKLNSVILNLPDTETIDSSFLRKCSGLESLNLDLPNTKTIDDYFLFYCTKLDFLKLYLPKVEKIGHVFLNFCANLTSIELSIPNLTMIGSNFISNCTILRFLELDLPKVKTIGCNFLLDCTKLNSVTLKLPNAETIGSYFLYRCSGLKSLNLDLPNVKEIGNNFLEGCRSLQEIVVTNNNEYLLERIKKYCTGKSIKITTQSTQPQINREVPAF